MTEKTLQSLHDEAISTGKGWYVHDGTIELVPLKDEDLPYNRDIEMKLMWMGVTWIWLR